MTVYDGNVVHCYKRRECTTEWEVDFTKWSTHCCIIYNKRKGEMKRAVRIYVCIHISIYVYDPGPKMNWTQCTRTVERERFFPYKSCEESNVTAFLSGYTAHDRPCFKASKGSM